jgi:hypothetical protein
MVDLLMLRSLTPQGSQPELGGGRSAKPPETAHGGLKSRDVDDHFIALL